MPRFWLVKSEPGAYAIDDLARDGRTDWTGVRNYQARNFMRDAMRVGDAVLFYHSNADPPGVAGLARVSGPARPDPTAPKGGPDWCMVEIAFVARFPEIVPLDRLKADPALKGMLVTKRGMRLSVQPVEEAHYRRIVALGRREARA